MYGINLKYRFPMLCAMIGSGLAGLLCGLNGVMANGIGVGGLPGILSIQPSYWQVFVLAMASPSSSRLYSPRLSISGNTARARWTLFNFLRGAIAPLALQE